MASLLTRVTSLCRYQAFFSSEGREMQMLSSGCAVGIACTFSAPAGGILYLFFVISNKVKDITLYLKYQKSMIIDYLLKVSFNSSNLNEIFLQQSCMG